MTLMHLLPENNLPTADIIQWFSISLPGHHLGPLCSLARALGQLVNQTEIMLQQQVHTLVKDPPDQLVMDCDDWLS